MKWTEGETVKFLELYREHECLWDVTIPNYRNNQMRVAALEKLVRDMGLDAFTVADARQKIKSLRNTYSQELQKIEKSIKSGMGADDVYTPTLKWFHIMNAFMKKSKEKRMTQSNLTAQPTGQNDDNKENELESEHGTTKETSTKICQSTSTTAGPSAGSPSIQKNAQKSTVRSSVAGSKRKYQDLSAAVSELRQMNQVLQQPETEEDEFDAFGNYMAIALKKLPLHLALECQNDLQCTLTRYRAMALSTVSSTSQSSTAISSDVAFRGRTQYSLYKLPLATPGYQQPLASPGYQQPLASPGYQQPLASSAHQQPLAPPGYQQPLASPDYQQPLASPGYQQPLASLDYQQPLASPDYQQPLTSPDSELSQSTSGLRSPTPSATQQAPLSCPNDLLML